MESPENRLCSPRCRLAALSWRKVEKSSWTTEAIRLISRKTKIIPIAVSTMADSNMADSVAIVLNDHVGYGRFGKYGRALARRERESRLYGTAIPLSCDAAGSSRMGKNP